MLALHTIVPTTNFLFSFLYLSIITHSFSDKEEKVAGTNPKDPNDVPPDGVVGANGKSAAVTAALLLDSDADGIVDIIEQEDGTDRFNPDSDGDGASDAEEKQAGTDPLDPSDTPAFEDANGNGKSDALDAALAKDSDGDHVIDSVEEYLGLDPSLADSDLDGKCASLCVLNVNVLSNTLDKL